MAGSCIQITTITALNTSLHPVHDLLHDRPIEVEERLDEVAVDEALHGLRLALVVEAAPRVVRNLADRADRLSHAVLQVEQEVEEFRWELRDQT